MGEVVKQLLTGAAYPSVHLIARRSTTDTLTSQISDSKATVSESVISFDEALDKKLGENPFDGCEQVFCGMGTTRANAGAAAQYAKDAGVKHFHYISSQGANANSSLLYPKTKGEIQDSLKAMGFDKLSIYQPGLLLCDRTEKRMGEAVMRSIGNVVAKVTNSGTVSTAKVAAA